MVKLDSFMFPHGNHEKIDDAMEVALGSDEKSDNLFANRLTVFPRVLPNCGSHRTACA